MLVGYNTNISYKKKVYHVQTEDSGRDNPFIITLLYQQGAILASRKTSYAHLLDDPDFKEKVRKMMQDQHKQIIRELISGAHTGQSTLTEPVEDTGQSTHPESIENTDDKPVDVKEPAEPISNSLDDVLLNYIMKRTNK